MTREKGIVFSYIRFSKKGAQERGDSVRRQTAGAKAWAEANGMKIDPRSYADLGLSGFHADHLKNPDLGGLATFLRAIERKALPSGPVYLCVENLDRLSRQDAVPALNLFTSILNAGVRIVQLTPAEMVYTDKSPAMELVFAIMELSRANSESAAKSMRNYASWNARKTNARDSGKPMTGQVPAWLKKDGDRFATVPAAARAVCRIYELAASGYGIANIIRHLNEEGVKPIGRVGHKSGVNVWQVAYVGRILNNRAVIGEYQPRKKDRTPDGEPLVAYFPTVVDESVYLRARAGLEKRKKVGKGRTGKVVNLFQGLMTEADTGESVVMDIRTARYDSNGGKWMNYRNSGFQLTGCRQFPMVALETALLGSLSELDPDEILPREDGRDQIKELSLQIEDHDGRLREIEDQLMTGGAVGVLSKVAGRLEAERVALVGQLAAAKTREASPQSEAWAAAQTLIGSMKAVEEREGTDQARMRLRAEVRRVVSGMRCIFVRKGRKQRALVQVNFVGSEAVRYVFVNYRGRANSYANAKPEYLKHDTFKAENVPISFMDLGDPEITESIRAGLLESIDTLKWE
ncbi:MAG TPA: recombinase family protein [Urbifossiella sp.]|nr:recombinase family protein [Urbifossiella sp.]